MWFKQLSPFLINLDLTAEQLEEKLATCLFKPMLGLDLSSAGFDFPNTLSPNLVTQSGNSLCIALKLETKVIPSAVVNNLLEKKIKEINNNEARSVGRKEKNELKERIIDDLLPKAFIKGRLIHALIYKKWLLINDSNSKRAECLLSKLNESCGTLDIALVNTQISPSSLMTEWLLRGKAAGSFEIGNSVILEGGGEIRSNIKVNKKDLTESEIIRHAELGMTVKEMELIWREQVSFVLNSNFIFKKISFLDVVQNQAQDKSDDAEVLWFAEQIICASALGEIIEELTSLLGGESSF